MNRQISFQQYRTIDLSIMAVLLVITQTLICIAATVWFKWELYIVSPVAIVTAIVMMRWGPWALLHAALGGVVYAVVAGGSLRHIAIYALGNLLSMAALVFFRKGKEVIRSSAVRSVLFGICVQLLMLLGRALMALVLGHSFWEALGFITTDSLSVLFTAVVVWIARRMDGLFEDQKHYLLRIQEQEDP